MSGRKIHASWAELPTASCVALQMLQFPEYSLAVGAAELFPPTRSCFRTFNLCFLSLLSLGGELIRKTRTDGTGVVSALATWP
jgi:hypothetical protein